MHGHRGQQEQQQGVLFLQALPSANSDSAATGLAAGIAMEDALDAIGLGRFHVLLLLCVSLVWAGAPLPAAANASACV